MNKHDKEECVDFILRVLERTSTWRKSLATKFPDDARNLRAANTLEKLAIDAPSLTDEQFRELEPYFNSWDSEKWRSALNQAARSVAFHHRDVSDSCTAFGQAVLIRGIFEAGSLGAHTYHWTFTPTYLGQPAIVLPVYEQGRLVDLLAIARHDYRVWGCCTGAGQYVGDFSSATREDRTLPKHSVRRRSVSMDRVPVELGV
jgi:hypothetical protein